MVCFIALLNTLAATGGYKLSSQRSEDSAHMNFLAVIGDNFPRFPLRLLSP